MLVWVAAGASARGIGVVQSCRLRLVVRFSLSLSLSLACFRRYAGSASGLGPHDMVCMLLCDYVHAPEADMTNTMSPSHQPQTPFIGFGVVIGRIGRDQISAVVHVTIFFCAH